MMKLEQQNLIKTLETSVENNAFKSEDSVPIVWPWASTLHLTPPLYPLCSSLSPCHCWKYFRRWKIQSVLLKWKTWGSPLRTGGVTSTKPWPALRVMTFTFHFGVPCLSSSVVVWYMNFLLMWILGGTHDSSSSQVPIVHVGDPDCIPSSWLKFHAPEATASTGGANQWIEALCFSMAILKKPKAWTTWCQHFNLNKGGEKRKVRIMDNDIPSLRNS